MVVLTYLPILSLHFVPVMRYYRLGDVFVPADDESSEEPWATYGHSSDEDDIDEVLAISNLVSGPPPLPVQDPDEDDVIFIGQLVPHPPPSLQRSPVDDEDEEVVCLYVKKFIPASHLAEAAAAGSAVDDDDDDDDALVRERRCLCLRPDDRPAPNPDNFVLPFSDGPLPSIDDVD